LVLEVSMNKGPTTWKHLKYLSKSEWACAWYIGDLYSREKTEEKGDVVKLQNVTLSTDQYI
jgi:hypothetical protein